MSIILGIDIGGSTTKIVGLRSDGTTIAMHRVQAQDPITSLYGAMGNFLFTNRLQLGDVSRIALTGVGASYIDDDIYGIPTEKVEEFAAVGVGGLALSGQDRAVVVSMGTGTAFIWAEKGKPVRHLCGSGVGGGTLAGLCSRLCGPRSYQPVPCTHVPAHETVSYVVVRPLPENKKHSEPTHAGNWIIPL